jgi:hypothetical protein
MASMRLRFGVAGEAGEKELSAGRQRGLRGLGGWLRFSSTRLGVGLGGQDDGLRLLVGRFES